ncbi:hypothetical protein C8R43DRAFT_1113965 [Mycena crocata]|nr:hypothetical protein C8R43DRAFT_1113965 [Mycena crocata]
MGSPDTVTPGNKHGALDVKFTLSDVLDVVQMSLTPHGQHSTVEDAIGTGDIWIRYAGSVQTVGCLSESRQSNKWQHMGLKSKIGMQYLLDHNKKYDAQPKNSARCPDPTHNPQPTIPRDFRSGLVANSKSSSQKTGERKKQVSGRGAVGNKTSRPVWKQDTTRRADDNKSRTRKDKTKCILGSGSGEAMAGGEMEFVLGTGIDGEALSRFVGGARSRFRFPPASFTFAFASPAPAPLATVPGIAAPPAPVVWEELESAPPPSHSQLQHHRLFVLPPQPHARSARAAACCRGARTAWRWQAKGREAERTCGWMEEQKERVEGGRIGKENMWKGNDNSKRKVDGCPEWTRALEGRSRRKGRINHGEVSADREGGVMKNFGGRGIAACGRRAEEESNEKEGWARRWAGRGGNMVVGVVGWKIGEGGCGVWGCRTRQKEEDSGCKRKYNPGMRNKGMPDAKEEYSTSYAEASAHDPEGKVGEEGSGPEIPSKKKKRECIERHAPNMPREMLAATKTILHSPNPRHRNVLAALARERFATPVLSVIGEGEATVLLFVGASVLLFVGAAAIPPGLLPTSDIPPPPSCSDSPSASASASTSWVLRLRALCSVGGHCPRLGCAQVE